MVGVLLYTLGFALGAAIPPLGILGAGALSDWVYMAKLEKKYDRPAEHEHTPDWREQWEERR